jgi:hypothetical protein
MPENSIRAVGGVAGVVALEIFGSYLLYIALPWSEERNLVFVGTVAQLLGVFLIAWPDLENTARTALSLTRRSLREGVTWARRAVRLAVAELRWLLYRAKEIVVNSYKRLRGRGRNITIRARPATATVSGNLAAVLIRGGMVEERLSRLEKETARFPGQWRADMIELRDNRIKLRWYGVPLVLIGILAIGIASW